MCKALGGWSLLTVLLVWFTLPATGMACGGFACSNQAPVVQSGESILFHVADGMIEAHVQVLYEGPSEDFAWIIPTPSAPTVGIGHPRVFRELQLGLRQRAQFTTQVEGTCRRPRTCTDGPSSAGSRDAAPDGFGPDAGEGDAGAVVVDLGQTGPYDFAVLQARSTEPRFEWLNANGYDIPDTMERFVEPYVLMEDDVHFVAFRLSKDREVGDIVPVTLRYAGTEPMIPIQLTAVASVADLPVHVFLLGPARAVPENYVHVVPNPVFRQPGWAGAGDGLALVPAVRAAGGQAFMTHYAGAPDPMAGRIFDDTVRIPLWVEDAPLEALLQDISTWLSRAGLSGDAGVVGAVARHITFGESAVAGGATAQGALECPRCFSWIGSTLDVAALRGELIAIVEEPLEHVQGLIDGAPTLTYLATVISPENMTRDPYFTFNPDLPDVANVVTGRFVQVCGRGRDPARAPWRTEYDDGLTIWGSAPGASVASAGAVLRIEELGSVGPPTIIADNTAQTEAFVASANATVRERLDRDPRRDRRGDECDDRACTAATPASMALWMAAPLVVGLRRRRR